MRLATLAVDAEPVTRDERGHPEDVDEEHEEQRHFVWLVNSFAFAPVKVRT